MWKSKKSNKNLKRVYVKYIVTGLNLTRFIDYVKKRGITIFSVKKLTDKSISLAVKISDSEIFFAIAKDLCYNVKRVGYFGLFYPIYYLINNVGIIVGSIIFVILPIILSDVIFSFSFVGSGAIYQREIMQFLTEKNVTQFSRFSSLDLRSLSDEILAHSNNLTFVEVQKKGNRLVVNSALSNSNTPKPQRPQPKLVSDVWGEVLEIKVYRGTAVVEKGQTVNPGDVLVDGVVTIKDKQVNVNVIAKVSINALFNYTYLTPEDNQQDVAIMFAKEQLNKGEITYSEVKKQKIDDKYEYRVTLKYKHIIVTE